MGCVNMISPPIKLHYEAKVKKFHSCNWITKFFVLALRGFLVFCFFFFSWPTIQVKTFKRRAEREKLSCCPQRIKLLCCEKPCENVPHRFSKNTGMSIQNHKEMNSANNYMSLEENHKLQKETGWPTSTLWPHETLSKGPC